MLAILADVLVALPQESEEVLTVLEIDQRRRQGSQLFVSDIPLAVGNFFRTTNLQTLAALDGRDKITGFQQRIVSAGVQPSCPTAEDFNLE